MMLPTQARSDNFTVLFFCQSIRQAWYLAQPCLHHLLLGSMVIYDSMKHLCIRNSKIKKFLEGIVVATLLILSFND